MVIIVVCSVAMVVVGFSVAVVAFVAVVVDWHGTMCLVMLPEQLKGSQTAR